MRMDRALDHVYGRAYTQRGLRLDVRDKGRKAKRGGDEGSVLALPEWLDEMRTLFPRSVNQIVQGHALARFGMTEILDDAKAPAPVTVRGRSGRKPVSIQALRAAAAIAAIARTYALVLALRRAGDDPILRGAVRQPYLDCGTLELVGCGLELWRTPTGARGVTAYALAPEGKGRVGSR